MKMGRGCIVLSDDWVRNERVDWESFAVFVPEKRHGENSGAANLPPAPYHFIAGEFLAVSGEQEEPVQEP